MPRTLQYARTDRDITEAFLSLLQEKSFEKITVSELIERAMVNRSTFYQHYVDKYAVLEALQQKYLTLFAEQTQQVQGLSDLTQINRLFESFFLKNKTALHALLSVRTESFDLRSRWKDAMIRSIAIGQSTLTELEKEMLSSLALDFLIYCMEHEEAASNFSTLFFDSMLNVALVFFHMDSDSTAREELLQLIAKYHQGGLV